MEQVYGWAFLVVAGAFVIGAYLNNRESAKILRDAEALYRLAKRETGGE